MLRLEATIDDFNKEVDDLMGSLKKSSEEKEKLIQQIKSGEKIKSDSKSKGASEDSKSKDNEEEPRELSEWEKKLEGIS